MPFVLLIAGVVLVTAGVRGKQDDLFVLLKGDVTGQPSFVSWMLAILFVGLLGYIDSIRPVSRAFLVLIVIVLFLSNGGFFQRFIKDVYAPATSGTSQVGGASSSSPISNLFPIGG